ncbi:MAG: hypothetical protein M0006_15980 [Magnetospirillum sp.]|nr:hypothetical protein [Magnetospirillum sp.]
MALDIALLVVVVLIATNLIAMAIGLVNPAKIFRNDPAPTRKKVLVGGGGVTVVLVAVLGGLATLAPADAPGSAPAHQVPPATPAPAAATPHPSAKAAPPTDRRDYAAQHALGISRGRLIAFFRGLGYGKGSIYDHQWMASKPTGISASIRGPANNPWSVSILSPATTNGTALPEARADMLALLKLMMPTWTGAKAWLAHGGFMVCRGRELLKDAQGKGTMVLISGASQRDELLDPHCPSD